MKILVEVTDGTKRVIVAHLLPNLLWHQEVYSKDQLQSMIVKDEPCEYCDLEPSEKIYAYGMCFKKIKVDFCPSCGRDLRKDVTP